MAAADILLMTEKQIFYASCKNRKKIFEELRNFLSFTFRNRLFKVREKLYINLTAVL